jgi:hypothetical protein
LGHDIKPSIDLLVKTDLIDGMVECLPYFSLLKRGTLKVEPVEHEAEGRLSDDFIRRRFKEFLPAVLGQGALLQFSLLKGV